jgi:hypothetical protein
VPLDHHRLRRDVAVDVLGDGNRESITEGTDRRIQARQPATRVTPAILTIVATMALFAAACGSPSIPAAKKDVVFWRPIGSWSGRGNVLTESFTSDSGSLRVRWTTSNVAPPGAGTFRLTARSAISGRPLKVAVDEQGAGGGTSYVDEDPHVFYMAVESANLDWSFTVEEAFAGTATAPSSK